MKYLFLLALLPINLFAQPFSQKEIAKWKQQAEHVMIHRDSFGVPHIYGKTDADAVFGLLYAQCEDDFARVEMNYIEKLGRLAEVYGENKLYDDLLIRLLIDQQKAKKDYDQAPAWLKKLCNAFADGINYYLCKNPATKPALLQRFEPWFPMLWTDGSIGAINTGGISTNELKNFYSTNATVALINNEYEEDVLTGSNGFAFSPKITASGNAILYINPHVTFYYRPEVHIVSEEGLNAYGAVTWGQFFIYQGFNEYCGWMHTSSGVDAADVYREKVSKKGNGYVYEYNGKQNALIQQTIVLQYKLKDQLLKKSIQTFATHHGPVLASRNNEWLSLKADNRLVNGLIQCWQRTRATSFNDYKKTLDLKGNISNNTVYADAEGNIAYWHGNRIPKRDTGYNWNEPVDGSTRLTEWKGYHAIEETVQSINPANGWLQNCNSTPFTVAGTQSPDKKNYPLYMAPDGENFRGINAVRTLSENHLYTIDKVIEAGYDKRLAAFEVLLPALLKYFDHDDTIDSLQKRMLQQPIEAMRSWDFRSGENSVATSLAVEWGQQLMPEINAVKLPDGMADDQVNRIHFFSSHTSATIMIGAFLKAVNQLEIRYGSWQKPWGEINRFQRISPAIDNVFDDNKPSLPVGFTSALWGQLPSYSSRMFAGTRKRYGFNGNSFICAVEFGKRIKAKSLLAGGNSGNPSSLNFFDQGEMYSKGIFKEVLFYKEDVLKNAKASYRPGNH